MKIKFAATMHRGECGEIDPDMWDVKSPGGEVIRIFDTRAKALELARHLSEQITYDVIYYRIVQAEKQAAHDRMINTTEEQL
jgi:hypothetical protein